MKPTIKVYWPQLGEAALRNFTDVMAALDFLRTSASPATITDTAGNNYGMWRPGEGFEAYVEQPTMYLQ